MVYCNFCVDHYDSVCDCCCPCVPSDTRDCFLNCCSLAAGIAFLVAVIVTAILLVVGFAFVQRPSVTIEDASLARFALATSPPTTAAYNISFTLKVRNPNWAMGVQFTSPLKAEYRFSGAGFGHVRIADRGEKIHARRTKVYPVATAAEFTRQRAAGVFQVEVVVTGEMLYYLHFHKCALAATCALSLRVGAPPALSQEVECDLAKAEKYC